MSLTGSEEFIEGASRRNVLKFFGMTAAVAAIPAAAMRPASAASGVNEEQQLNEIVKALDSLPEHLKNQDPASNPNYEDDLREHLGNITVLSPPVEASEGMGTAAFNPIQCPVEVAKFAATTAFPVAKIVGWIRKARQIWGSVANIRYAIRSGQAAGEIGPEAAAVLEGVLGLGGVRKQCFG